MKEFSKSNQYLLKSAYFTIFAQGFYLLIIGAALPSLRAEYHLDYKISGAMMSVQSVGYLVSGAVFGILPRYFDVKKVYILLGNLAFAGLLIMTLTGNPILLLISMGLTGVSKGCVGNFNNQIVSNLTGNDAGKLNFLQACFAMGACAAPLTAVLCGADWRLAFRVVIAAGVANLLFSLRMKIGPDAYNVSGKEAADFGFFKKKVFWICALFLSCYMAIEACVMGFLVTYYVDTGMTGESGARFYSTLLWVALLIGRLESARLSAKIKPYILLTAMTAGAAVSFTLFIFGQLPVLIVIGSVGLGLFMAGMYGTAVGDVGNLLEKYPMCMGVFIVIPGIVATVIPGAVGIVADAVGIRKGLMVLYILITLLFVISFINIRFHHSASKEIV